MNTEVALLQNMLAGDEKAFRTLYDQYYNYLMVVGLRYLRDKLRVEDVINDVFMGLWNIDREVEIEIAVKSYLRGALVNKCLSVLRKENRMDWVDEHRENITDSSNSVERNLEGKQVEEIVQQVVDALPPKCQQVYNLSRNEGLSHKEIAAKLEISTKTIENHMSRALKGLRAELKKYGILLFIVGSTIFILQI